jgi:L-fucose mutarotase
VLRYPLLHPQILQALARAGHGSRVLIADANYPYRTAAGPLAEIVFLNLRPGLVSVDDVLKTLLTAITVEAAATMKPDGDQRPEIVPVLQALLPQVSLEPVPRHDFYACARGDDVALIVATGDQRLYANILLTIGVVTT